MSFLSSPFPSCFRPSKTTTADHNPPPSLSGNPNLTTYIYETDAGTVSLTWSRSILGRTLHVHIHTLPNSSFHLHIKPFVFWKRNGSKKLSHNTTIFWNLSKARFGSRSPEPESEPHSKFYIAVVVDHVLVLLVGDNNNDEKLNARGKFRARQPKNPQLLVLKREHVDVDIHNNETSSYATKVVFGEKVREIKIDCDEKNSRLLFCVDGERLLEVKRLKWKFRGNERVEVDGVFVQISWDLHDWVFENNGGGGGGGGDGHAVFMFKFEEKEVRGGEERGVIGNMLNLLEGYEIGKTGKSMSSSSLSSSVGSFGGSSSVLEWASVEESELVVPVGFSLLVYAWKR